MTPDFYYVNNGTTWTIHALSKDAKDWARTHFAPEPWQGRPTHFTTDWRVARDLVRQLKLEDGFEVEDAT